MSSTLISRTSLRRRRSRRVIDPPDADDKRPTHRGRDVAARRIDLKITSVRLSELQQPERIVRKHSPEKIAKLARQIDANGFLVPIIVDGASRVVCGWARVQAAKKCHIPEIPAIRLEHLSDAQLRAWRIADNRLCEEAEWDKDALRLEFASLLEIDPAFDLQLTAFEVPEIDLIIGDGDPPDSSAEEHPEPDRDQPSVSRLGDRWQLGEHRLLCGDALDPNSYSALLQGETASMVFIDPPYNVPIAGNVSGLGRVTHREFVMGSGELSAPGFKKFLVKSLRAIGSVCEPGALIYVCMDWRHLRELQAAGRKLGLPLLNLVVWKKTNAGMGSFYRSQHELILLFKAGNHAHRNNVQLGRHGRNRTNVWEYAGVNTFREGRDDDLRMHPTVKPVRMISDAIVDCTQRGEIVLDSFAGSGSTILAAERVDRRARVMELDPAFVDVAVRRWERETGIPAINTATGFTFAQTTARRLRRHPRRAA